MICLEREPSYQFDCRDNSTSAMTSAASSVWGRTPGHSKTHGVAPGIANWTDGNLPVCSLGWQRVLHWGLGCRLQQRRRTRADRMRREHARRRNEPCLTKRLRPRTARCTKRPRPQIAKRTLPDESIPSPNCGCVKCASKDLSLHETAPSPNCTLYESTPSPNCGCETTPSPNCRCGG